MKWAIENPARFLSEREGIERLRQEGWLTGVRWLLGPNGNILVEFEVTVGSMQFQLLLTYPDFFPDTPAFVRPRDRLRWSEHQYGAGGSLCLEYRPDNWHANVTGADLIRSAFVLLSAENGEDNARQLLSAHRLTVGQTLRQEHDRLVGTASLIQALRSIRAERVMKGKSRTILHDDARVTFVSHLEEPHGKLKELADVPNDKDAFEPLFAVEGDVLIFQVDESQIKSEVESPASLTQRLGVSKSLDALFPSPETDKIQPSRFVLLKSDRPTSIRAFRLVNGDAPRLFELAVILPEANSERLPSSCRGLRERKVAVVGLGSIGSKIAVSLARSGIRKFVVVDDDLLLPENLRRNELNWSAVGVHKTKGVRELIALVAPGCEVYEATHRISGQESSAVAAAVIARIADCDLIVDATADTAVFLLLAAIAKRNRKPLCWGELFAGGIGGLIARARPDLDPNPFAMRGALVAHLSTLPPAPYQTAISYDSDSVRPLIAYDSDVGQIASALTRLSIDTLLTGSVFPFPAYLIGLRKEWIFSQPFDVHPIAASGEGWDPPPVVSEKEASSALEILLALVAERKQ